MELKSGVCLQGNRYRIERTLGRGGFGVTYLAEQLSMNRKVCIKEFFPKGYYKRDSDTTKLLLDAESFGSMMERFKGKFVKEALTIAMFNHPNIITIHDVFEENDTAYYVMEYIEGDTLGSLIKKSGALDESQLRSYVTQVASALEYVHANNTVHLDVKPDNIMLSNKDGRAVLIDFGLSKHYDKAGLQTTTTPIGLSHGYSPIEQYQSAGVSLFKPSSDIYSLGATIYTLVTGMIPPLAAVVANEGIPELPKSLNPNIRKAIQQSMNVSMNMRPQTIAEFLRIFNSNMVVTKPKKSKWWLWLLLVFAVVVCVVAYFAYKDESNPNPNPDIHDNTVSTTQQSDIAPDSVDNSQLAVPILALSAEQVTVEHEGGSGTIDFAVENPLDGVSVEVSDNASWISVRKSGNTISYDVVAKETQGQRTGTITVSYGEQNIQVRVVQNGIAIPEQPAQVPATLSQFVIDTWRMSDADALRLLGNASLASLSPRGYIILQNGGQGSIQYHFTATDYQNELTIRASIIMSLNFNWSIAGDLMTSRYVNASAEVADLSISPYSEEYSSLIPTLKRQLEDELELYISSTLNELLNSDTNAVLTRIDNNHLRWTEIGTTMILERVD